MMEPEGSIHQAGPCPAGALTGGLALQNHEFLRKIAYFARLSDEQLQLLLPHLRERTLAAGEVVFHQGDELAAVYFVREGQLKAVILTETGQEKVMHLLGPGDSFPHVGLVEGGEYPATITALAPSRLTYLRRTDLLRIAAQHGELAVQLIDEMGDRIRRLQEQLKEMSLLDLPGRVASLLLRLSRPPAQGPEGRGTPLPAGAGAGRAPIILTHAEIASMVGGSREAVTRTLAGFRRRGWIGAEKGAITVLDAAALSEFLDAQE